ncbi:hypothetical protein [Mycoplasma sp. 392]
MTKSSKVLLALSSVLGIVITASTVGLALTKQDFDKNQSDLYKTFTRSKEQFQTYKDFWNFSQESQNDLNQKLTTAESSWADETKTLKEKIQAINDFQNTFLNNVINWLKNNIDYSLSSSNQIELQSFLYSQRNRIQEQSVYSYYYANNPQFSTDIDTFVSGYNNISKEDKLKLLDNFSEMLTDANSRQSQLLDNVLGANDTNYLVQYKQEIDSLPSKVLKNQANDLINQIESKLLESKYSYNELTILKNKVQDVLNLYTSNKDKIDNFVENINENINVLKTFATQNTENSVVSQKLIDLANNYLDKLNNCVSVDDFEKLSAETSNAATHAIDRTKSIEEIKNNWNSYLSSQESKISVLKPYAENIKNSDSYKNFIENNNYNEVIESKANYTNQFSNLVLLEQKIANIHKSLSDSFNEDLIDSAKYNLLKQELTQSVNANLTVESLDKKINKVASDVAAVVSAQLFAKNTKESIEDLNNKISQYSNVSWFNDDKDVLKAKLKEIYLQIDSVFNNKNLSSEDVKTLSASLEEKYRQTLIESLNGIDAKIAQFLALIYNKPNTDELAKQIEDFIEEEYTKSIADDTTDTAQIYKDALIRRLKELAQASVIYKTIELKEAYDDADKYARITYNRANDLIWKPSNAVKKQLDMLDKYLDEYNKLNYQSWYQEPSDDLTKKLDELNKSIQNYRQNIDSLNDIDATNKEINDLIENISKDPLKKEQLKDQIANIKKLQEQSEQLFADENAKKEDIESLKKQLQSALNSLKDSGQSADLTNGLDLIQQELDKYYNTDELKSQPGYQTIVQKAADLKKLSEQKQLSDEDKASLLQEIYKVKDAVSLTYSIEEEIKKLQTEEQKVTSDADAKDFVNGAKQLNSAQIEEARSLVSKINSDLVPDLRVLQSEIDALKNRETETNNALLKDKITKYNQGIANKTTDSDSEVAKQYENAKNNITNTWYGSLVNSNSTTSLEDTLDKIKAIDSLNKTTADALDWVTSNKNNKYDNIFSELEDVVSDNLLLANDTVESSQEKEKNIKTAFEVAKSKLSLSESLDNLNSIFTQDDKKKVIYEDLVAEVESLSAEYSSYVDSNFLSSTELDNKKKELDAKIAEILAAKKQIDTNWQQAVDDIDTNVVNKTDAAIEALKQVSGNENDTFPLYDAAKAKYEAAKEDPSTDLETLANLKTEMLNAFERDKLNNRLTKLEALANSDNFNTDNVENPAKNAIDTTKAKILAFTEDLKNKLTNADLTEEQINQYKQQISDSEKLSSLQSNVAQQLKEWDAIQDASEKESKQQSLSSLATALTKSYPTRDLDYNDSPEKYEELKKAYDFSKEADKWKTDNFNAIQDQTSGIKKQLNDDLSSNATEVDPDTKQKLEEQLDNLLQKNNDAKSIDELKKLQDFIEELKDNQDKVIDLSKEVQKAKNTLENAKDTTQLSALNLKRELESLVEKAQNNYVPQDMNIDTLNSLKQQIIETRNNLELALEIEDLIKQAKLVLNGQPNEDNGVKYYEFQGTPGTTKLSQVNKWLDNIQNDSLATDGTQNSVLLPAIKARAQKALELMQQLKVVSDQITDWKAPENTYSGYATDIELLLSKLWTNSPKASERYEDDKDSQKIVTQINNLKTSLQAIQDLHSARMANNENIESFKTSKVEQDSFKTDFATLYKYISRSLSAINKQNIESTELSQLKAESGNIAVNKKLQELEDAFESLLKLAKQVKASNTIYDSVQANYPEVMSSKTKLSNLLEDVIDLYVSTDVASINQKTKELASESAKLNLLNKYQIIRAQVDTDRVLSQSEKAYLESLFTEFRSKLDSIDTNNSSAADYDDLYNTYLNNATETEKSIPFVFENTVALKLAINKANEYLSYENIGIKSYEDSSDTKTKYSALRTVVQNANQNLQSGTTQHKKESVEALNTAISELIEQRKSDIDKVKEKITWLKNKIQEQIDNSEQTKYADFSQILDSDFDAKTLDLLNQEIPADSNPIDEVNKRIHTALETYSVAIVKAYDFIKSRLDNAIKTADETKNDFLDTTIRSYAGNDIYTQMNSLASQASQHSNQTFNIDNYLALGLSENQDFSTWFKQSRDYWWQLGDFPTQLANNVNQKLHTLVKSDLTGLFDKLKAFLIEKDSEFGMKYILETGTNDIFTKSEMTDAKNIFVSEFLPKYSELSSTYSATQDLSKFDYDSIFTQEASSMNETLNSYYSFVAAIKSKANTIYNNEHVFDNLIREVLGSDPTWQDIAKNKLNANLQGWKEILNNYNSETVNANTFSDVESNLNVVPEDSSPTFALKKLIDKVYDFTKLPSKFITDLFTNLYLYGGRYEAPQNGYNNVDYKHVVPKSTTTRTKFGAILSSLAGENSNEIDVTNATSFTDLFEKFSSLSSLGGLTFFDSTNVRLKILKWEDGSWYKVDPSQDTETIKKATLRLKFEYTPNNLTEFKNIESLSIITGSGPYDVYTNGVKTGEMSFDDVTVSFNSVDWAQVSDGSSELIFQGENTGYQSKVALLDVNDAGWATGLTKEQYENKMFEAFKNTLKANNSDLDKNQVVQKENNNALVMFKPSNTDIENMKIEFLNSPVLNYERAGFSVIYQDLANQMIVINADDTNKEIVLVEVVPGTLVSGPTASAAANSSEYGDLVGQGKAYAPTKAGISVYQNQYTMPAATVYLYKFKFEYNESDNKMYLYNSWMETQSYYKDPSFHDSVNPSLSSNYTPYTISYTGGTPGTQIWQVAPEKWIINIAANVLNKYASNVDTGSVVPNNNSTITTSGYGKGYLKDDDFISSDAFAKIYKASGRGKLIWSSSDNPTQTTTTSDLTQKPLIFNSGTKFFKFKIR